MASFQKLGIAVVRVRLGRLLKRKSMGRVENGEPLPSEPAASQESRAFFQSPSVASLYLRIQRAWSAFRWGVHGSKLIPKGFLLCWASFFEETSMV